MYKRVSAQAFVKYLQSRTTSVSHGGRVKDEVWAVPRLNFPEGLPQEVAANELSEDTLEQLQLVGGGQADKEIYYFIDQQCPRHLLGKQVKTLEFFTASITKVAGEKGASSSHNALGSGAPVASPTLVVVPKSSPCIPVPRSDAEAGPTLKRHTSEPSEDEAPEVKKARRRLDTLRALRDNIVTAARQELWSSDNPLVHDTVAILVSEALVVLNEITQDTGNSEHRLVTKFSKFLVKHLMASSGYLHMHHFRNTFTDLENMGAEESGEGRLIQALADVAAGSEDFPNLSVADVVARTAFRSSNLFKSFIAARVQSMVQKAT